MITRVNANPKKEQQTATPDKYPQGYFKEKKCRCCKCMFKPKAPSELYCSDDCKDKASTNKYLKRTYGITYRQYRLMHEAQGGRCKICDSEGFVMANHHKMKLVVDQCHATGKVRGLLCHNCNRALGLLHDNIEHLSKAIDYLKV